MMNKAGFRIGVGMVVCNSKAQLLWAKRVGEASMWQFPQGGLQKGETPETGLYRELYEELGLKMSDVQLLGHTQSWLQYRYSFPKLHYNNSKQLYVGQTQKWFLLQLLSTDSTICLNCSDTPEFDQWRWVDYGYPAQNVVDFKRKLYQAALEELEVFLPHQSISS